MMLRRWAAMLRRWAAKRLRFLADRIDQHGAPRRTGMCFEFVMNHGLEVNWSGNGCPLWYYGNDDYELSYARDRVKGDGLSEDVL